MAEQIQDLEAGIDELPDDPTYLLGSTRSDRRDGRVYVHTERIRWAVKVAQATGRPLLLRGPSGSGKSSLAPFVSRAMHRKFYAATVHSRTQARDLMYEFDSLRRLADAQANDPRARMLHHYLEPRALWWAFDPVSARLRGLRDEDAAPHTHPATDPGVGPPDAEAVVLIDEIDKADSDVPNSLLEALGSNQFSVAELGIHIEAGDRRPLILITTNEERDLPAAFMRRCIVLVLPEHDKTELVRIALAHFGKRAELVASMIADEVLALRKDKEFASKRHRPPSTAEFLDAVKACLDLGLDPRTQREAWDRIAEFTLLKSPIRFGA